MVEYSHKRALIVMAVSAATTLGFCWLANEALSQQQCLQWSCTTVNASSINPIQYCTCMVAAPSYPAGGPPGSYASDAPAADPLARWR